jgi:hypothetical protein
MHIDPDELPDDFGEYGRIALEVAQEVQDMVGQHSLADVAEDIVPGLTREEMSSTLAMFSAMGTLPGPELIMSGRLTGQQMMQAIAQTLILGMAVQQRVTGSVARTVAEQGMTEADISEMLMDLASLPTADD